MPMSATELELPALSYAGDSLVHLSDERLAQRSGVHVVFTGRSGGISPAPFDRLNLSGQVGDDPVNVNANRELLRTTFALASRYLVIPHQVHKTDYLVLDGRAGSPLPATIEPETIDVDAVIVDRDDVAAMLCFADCVPVVVVTPGRRFAVVHAGWRGVYASIARRVVAELAVAERPASFNVYIGPHIGAECFECAPEVHKDFRRKFGDGCVFDARHIDLSAALVSDLLAEGISPERICDCGICTVCESDRYFSYRAADGYCGRQAAVAWREEPTVGFQGETLGVER